NEQISKYAVQDPELEGMGTTCVVVMLKEKEVFFAHAGDSRLYLLRNGKLAPLTKDHSRVQEMIEKGEITPQEVLSHPERSLITRALGMENVLEPEIGQSFEAGNGDKLLLCSDGLYNMLSNSILEQILTENAAAQDKAIRLVQRAKDAGGYDNISVQVIEFQFKEQKIILPTTPLNFFEKNIDESSENISPTIPKVVKEKKIVDEEKVPKSEVKNTFQPKPEMSEKTPPAVKTGKKVPDIALIVLLVLFGVVLTLFFLGSGMTKDPKPSELNISQTPDTNAVAEPMNEEPLDNQQETTAITTPKKDEKPVTKPEKPKKIPKDTLISYTVQAGDNLRKIAQRFNMKTETLKKLNRLDDNEIKTDQKLKIKVRTVHTVAAGDVLSRIADQYKTNRELIKKANDMTDNATKRGTKLIIPLAKAE
ncbi:MAG: LysM peptidoglycan-binding domain-containing protein, partial [Verrucomicrobia bacterium]|nr:LysM peptidoglycan-binding domain-containing protein [Cytophagales bacterium]